MLAVAWSCACPCRRRDKSSRRGASYGMTKATESCTRGGREAWSPARDVGCSLHPKPKPHPSRPAHPARSHPGPRACHSLQHHQRSDFWSMILRSRDRCWPLGSSAALHSDNDRITIASPATVFRLLVALLLLREHALSLPRRLQRSD